MITRMELKLRDKQQRTVLVQVDHNPDMPTDYTAISYTVIGVGVNHVGRDMNEAAKAVQEVTHYRIEPLRVAIASMVDSLLDLSVNSVRV